MKLTIQILRGALYAIILMMLYLYGCSGTPVTKTFDPMLQEFEKDIGVSTKGTKIYFADLSGQKVGTCYVGTRVIHLDRDYWKYAGEWSRKALLYHELGHCVCNILIHSKERQLGCDFSLMGKAMETERCYRDYWDRYVRDLKARCQ
jgi:hypothetical protein